LDVSVVFVVLGSSGGAAWPYLFPGRQPTKAELPLALHPYESTMAAGEDIFFKTKKATQN